MGNNKIKVLIIMHGAGTGGVEKSIVTLCTYLINKEGIEPIVAVPEDGLLTETLKGMGIKTFITPLEWWTPIWFFYGERHYYKFLAGLKQRVDNLVKIINENDINVVHTSTLSVIDGAIAARISRRPHIWHLHGRFDGSASSSFGTYFPIDVIYSIVDQLSWQIVAVSQTVKVFLSSYIIPSKIKLIYNGIDIDKFNGKTAPSKSLFEEFPTLKNKVLVGLVGRIAKVKGIEDYVEAAIEVLKLRDNVSFLIVGPEEDKALGKKVTKRIDSLHLADKIIFTGYREDIPALLKQMDLVVCSSLKEGFPYSCLEAMAASKALVATKCGGPNELIVDGETGYLVDVGKADKLARAILKAVENPEAMMLMGEKGRQRIEEFFEARIYARSFEDLYLDVEKTKTASTSCSYLWPKIFMTYASDYGALGLKVMKNEHEIQELKSLNNLIKNNFIYRKLKKIYSLFSN